MTFLPCEIGLVRVTALSRDKLTMGNIHEYVVVQLYRWFKVCFPQIETIIIKYHSPKQRNIKFEPIMNKIELQQIRQKEERNRPWHLTW